MNIPPNLLASLEAGSVVLVLGAGASIGAIGPNGMGSPTGPELTKLIAEKFLGGQFAEEPLSWVADLAISESDLSTVQEFIRTIFQPLEPAPFHLLLPTFKWAALATTNFDLVVERAYANCRNSAQDVVPFIKDGDRVEERLRSPRSLMLLKLHGCISRTTDTAVPLILTTDQYVSHRDSRQRIFDHLKGKAHELPLVFVGHSLRDSDIRALLLELGDSNSRPMFYAVAPGVTDMEKRLWGDRRVALLEGTFEEFLTSIDGQISSPFRGIVPAPIIDDLPISERFTSRHPDLSIRCMEFLNNDVEYVRSGMLIADVRPHMFYRGSNPRWSAIERNLDFRRDTQDMILADAILSDQTERGCKLYVLKGHAGSGKSVLLQRIAWEASIEYERLCLYLEPNGDLPFESIHELARVVDERIYLFVDDIGDHVPQVMDLISRCRRHNVQVTVFGAERINEWNMSCNDLEPYVTDEFVVRYLSRREIDRLLGLLEEHRALFRLESMGNDERREAFTERAGRQLLVALHEATLGKPFEDIIADEYSEVRPELARLMYLGVSFLNQFDVPVRAGLINRLYDVRFEDFSERFFSPLETVVSARYDKRTRDYAYVTRHPHIAEIVVQRFLPDPQQRLDMTTRMLGTLNIDYDADRKAFRRLMRGRSLLDQFPDHRMVETIYGTAMDKVGEDPYLLQQIAIYEMNRPNGNLDKAAGLLARAGDLAPRNDTITHSLAELQLRLAQDAKSELQSTTHLKEAQKLAKPLTRPSAVDSHGFHTLAKVQLSKLSHLVAASGGSWNEVEFGEMVKEAEEVIQGGLQRFPDDPHLLIAESQLAQLLADDDRAQASLRSAFDRNPTNPIIAVRLAKLLLGQGLDDDAVAIYEQALTAGVDDKQVHFNYAKLLMDRADRNGSDIEYHLRRAFIEGDPNVEAQFWYARQLYLNGSVSEATRRFRQLKDVSIDQRIKRAIRGRILDGSRQARFTGSIDRLEYNYAFIARDGESDRVFLSRWTCKGDLWDALGRFVRVSFSIGFNFLGASAFEVTLE